MTGLAWLPLLSIAASAVFAGLVVWLHVVRRDVRPRSSGLSQYALGSTTGVATTAFLALSVALVCTAIVIRHRSPRFGAFLLMAAAIGSVIVALVPVSEPPAAPWRHAVHSAGALVLFVASSAATLALSAAMGAALAVLSWLQMLSLVAFLAGMGGVPGLVQVRGWLQRSVFATLVLWLIVVSWRSCVAGM